MSLQNCIGCGHGVYIIEHVYTNCSIESWLQMSEVEEKEKDWWLPANARIDTYHPNYGMNNEHF